MTEHKHTVVSDGETKIERERIAAAIAKRERKQKKRLDIQK